MGKLKKHLEKIIPIEKIKNVKCDPGYFEYTNHVTLYDEESSAFEDHEEIPFDEKIIMVNDFRCFLVYHINFANTKCKIPEGVTHLDIYHPCGNDPDMRFPQSLKSIVYGVKDTFPPTRSSIAKMTNLKTFTIDNEVIVDALPNSIEILSVNKRGRLDYSGSFKIPVWACIQARITRSMVRRL